MQLSFYYYYCYFFEDEGEHKSRLPAVLCLPGNFDEMRSQRANVFCTILCMHAHCWQQSRLPEMIAVLPGASLLRAGILHGAFVAS